MNDDNKVLACVDHSRFADHVADHAAWAARQLGAALEFLHVIDRDTTAQPPEQDRSGAIGFDAQAQLLNQLCADDAARSKAARERGRVFLQQLRERAIATGLDRVDARQRRGELAQTLAELESGATLLVLGRRGEAAEATRRDLGRNVEHVVRALHKPVLAVTEGFREPRRVLIAFDGGSVTRRGVDMLARSPLLRGLSIELLMSGQPGTDAARLLDWARATLQAASFEVNATIRPGDAETLIARTVQEQSIDLLVMGAFGHSPLRSLLLGSKTADLLRSSPVPTLLLR